MSYSTDLLCDSVLDLDARIDFHKVMPVVTSSIHTAPDNYKAHHSFTLVYLLASLFSSFDLFPVHPRVTPESPSYPPVAGSTRNSTVPALRYPIACVSLTASFKDRHTCQHMYMTQSPARAYLAQRVAYFRSEPRGRCNLHNLPQTTRQHA